MADWEGEERRQLPHEYQLRSIIREELTPIQRQQAEMRQAQLQVERKINEWELGAKWFRIFIVGTVGIVATAAGIWEWMRTHLR